MSKFVLPSNLSYTVLVHAGSYKDFETKLEQCPFLFKRFEKKLAIHYYIIQLEDVSEKGVSKQIIYGLPIMAMREEFSNYIFFKNTKSYNSVLKRMCNAKDNKEAAYELAQHMMTPLEKSRILKLQDANSLEIEEENEAHKILSISYKKSMLNSEEVMDKIFALKEVIVDNEEKVFSELVKTQNWIIGIHR